MQNGLGSEGSFIIWSITWSRRSRNKNPLATPEKCDTHTYEMNVVRMRLGFVLLNHLVSLFRSRRNVLTDSFDHLATVYLYSYRQYDNSNNNCVEQIVRDRTKNIRKHIEILERFNKSILSYWHLTKIDHFYPSEGKTTHKHVIVVTRRMCARAGCSFHTKKKSSSFLCNSSKLWHLQWC